MISKWTEFSAELANASFSVGVIDQTAAAKNIHRQKAYRVAAQKLMGIQAVSCQTNKPKYPADHVKASVIFARHFGHLEKLTYTFF